MDWATLIVGCVTALAALLGSFLAHNKTTAVMEVRLKALESKMDKHNKLQERMKVCEITLQSAHKRLDDTRETIHKIEDDIKDRLEDVHK